MDPELFKYPYLYVVEPGRMELSNQEVERLREYMVRGGFMHFDDFWGLSERANVEYELGRIFPDKELRQLDMKEEIFHTFFDVHNVMQIPNVRNGCDGGQPGSAPTIKSQESMASRTTMGDNDRRYL
jgi:hypothetical protein